MTFLLNALVAKRLEILREIVPSVSLVGIMVNPGNPNAPNDVEDVEGAARALGLRTAVEHVLSESEIEPAFESLERKGAGALILLPDPNFLTKRNQIVALAARHLLPSMYFGREFAVAGGLMTYSASLTEAYRLAGNYVSRILKGEKPADLPVVQPTRFELVDQPQDRQGARPRNPADPARPRRRGDRMREGARQAGAISRCKSGPGKA